MGVARWWPNADGAWIQGRAAAPSAGGLLPAVRCGSPERVRGAGPGKAREFRASLKIAELVLLTARTKLETLLGRRAEGDAIDISDSLKATLPQQGPDTRSIEQKALATLRLMSTGTGLREYLPDGARRAQAPPPHEQPHE